MKRNVAERAGIFAGVALIITALVLTFMYGFTWGNSFALAGGLLLVFLGWGFRRLPRIWKRVAGSVLAAGMSLFVALTVVEIVHGCRDTVQFNEDCVMVLGAGVRGEEVLPVLKARLDKCIEYLGHNAGVPVILTGGRGEGENLPEAEAMARYLVKNGVNPARIVREDQARDTKDNIAFSKRITDSMFPDGYSVACITSDFHTYRVQRIVGPHKMEVRYMNSGVKWYLRPAVHIREAISICKYWILEWLR